MSRDDPIESSDVLIESAEEDVAPKLKKINACLSRIQNFSNIKPEFKFDNAKFDPAALRAAIYAKDSASPKLAALFKKIKELDEADRARGKLFKHYIFSDVKQGYGARIITSAFFAEGFECAYERLSAGEYKLQLPAAPQPLGPKSFVFLPGNACWNKTVPAKLGKDVSRAFNRPENAHGEFIRFIILDSKYKEGLDLKDVKYCHLFDPLNRADELQAVGRGARNCGQKNLPFEKGVGWKLHVFRYSVTVPPEVLRKYHLKEDGTMLELITATNPRTTALEKAVFPKLMRELDWFGMKIAVDRLLTEAIHTEQPARFGGGMEEAEAERVRDEELMEDKYSDFKPTALQKAVQKSCNKLAAYTVIQNGCRATERDVPTMTVEVLQQVQKRLASEMELDPDDADLKRFAAAVRERLASAGVAKVGTLVQRKYTPLTASQQFIQDYVTPAMPTKGILLWHSPGSGKTCAAVAMATNNFEPAGYSLVWVTRANMREDVAKNVSGLGDASAVICDAARRGRTQPVCQAGGAKAAYMGRKAWCGGPISYQTFSNFLNRLNRKPGVSSEAFYNDYMNSTTKEVQQIRAKKDGDPLHKCLIVIDEAHKLYNRELPPNEKPDLAALEKMIHRSYAKSGKDSVRVVLMTATPYTYSPLEFFKLMNLVREDVLPTELEKIDLAHGHMTPALIKKYDGYISYVDVSKDKSRFAQIEYVNDPALVVRMSGAQTDDLDALSAALKRAEVAKAALEPKTAEFDAEQAAITAEYKSCDETKSFNGLQMSKRKCAERRRLLNADLKTRRAPHNEKVKRAAAELTAARKRRAATAKTHKHGAEGDLSQLSALRVCMSRPGDGAANPVGRAPSPKASPEWGDLSFQERLEPPQPIADASSPQPIAEASSPQPIAEASSPQPIAEASSPHISRTMLLGDYWKKTLKKVDSPESSPHLSRTMRLGDYWRKTLKKVDSPESSPHLSRSKLLGDYWREKTLKKRAKKSSQAASPEKHSPSKTKALAQKWRARYHDDKAPPDWSLEQVGGDDWFRRAKQCRVYAADTVNRAELAVVVSEREPVNIEMESKYNDPKIKSGYSRLFKADHLPPNFALYMPAIMSKEEQHLKEPMTCHVINCIGFGFDVKAQPDYQYFMENFTEAKKKELQDRLAVIFKLVFQCAADLKLRKICMCYLGGSEFARLFKPSKPEYLKIFLAALKTVLTPQVLAGIDEINLMGATNRHDMLMRLVGKEFEPVITGLGKTCHLLGRIPDILTEDMLFMNAWDPHSVVGNGNEYDRSLDGFFGRLSDMGYMSIPEINPYLLQNIRYVETHEKTPTHSSSHEHGENFQIRLTFPEWDDKVRTALKTLKGKLRSIADVSESEPLNYKKTNIEIDDEKVDPKEFRKVKTVGDGTCLIHAYLTSTSEVYRSIPYKEKSAVGIEVRRMLQLPESESDGWLSDDHLEELNAVAGTQLLYINKVSGQTMARVVSPPNANGPFIIIVNEGASHFSSVTYKGKYSVDTVVVDL